MFVICLVGSSLAKCSVGLFVVVQFFIMVFPDFTYLWPLVFFCFQWWWVHVVSVCLWPRGVVSGAYFWCSVWLDGCWFQGMSVRSLIGVQLVVGWVCQDDPSPIVPLRLCTVEGGLSESNVAEVPGGLGPDDRSRRRYKPGRVKQTVPVARAIALLECTLPKNTGDSIRASHQR